ncbi:hypothetical protein NDU88_013329 [Pleurodeles waltl]|uniref:Uncharacterized protein n=1 Tax=Pleurodeles waltl TaxID=8319 RepID=A0AAV7R5B5_PLEWA|nr:hypothetical protein NDU88_013329 [Pleurodeles waltl]
MGPPSVAMRRAVAPSSRQFGLAHLEPRHRLDPGAGPRSRPRGSERLGRVAPVDVLLGSGLTGPRTARSQLLHALRSLAIP